MTLDPRRSPAAFSQICSWAVVALAGLLPIWEAPHGLSVWWMTTYDEPMCMWRVLRFLPDEINGWGAWETLRGHQDNLLRIAIAFCAGGIFGRAYYWWRWEWRSG
jgi:hypothetical protein